MNAIGLNGWRFMAAGYLLLAVLALAHSQNAWSVPTIVCSGTSAQVGVAVNGVPDPSTSRLTITTTYPLPEDLFKICEVPAHMTLVTIVETLINDGLTPWHDWESVLCSVTAGVHLQGATVSDPLITPPKASVGITSGGSCSDQPNANLLQLSIESLHVLFGAAIGNSDEITLTQTIVIPDSVTPTFFTMHQTPSVGEPSVLWLFAASVLALFGAGRNQRADRGRSTSTA